MLPSQCREGKEEKKEMTSPPSVSCFTLPPSTLHSPTSESVSPTVRMLVTRSTKPRHAEPRAHIAPLSA